MTTKVLYIVPPTGSYAGIERVIDEIGSELALRYRDRLTVDVLHLSEYKNFSLPERPYRKLQENSRNRRHLLRLIRQTVSRQHYHLVVVPQVEATVICWVACFGLGRRFVLYLHGNPNREMRSTKSRILFYVMGNLVLHRLSCVFGTSPRQLKSFQAMFPSDVPHIWVPNPVRQFELSKATRDTADCVCFVNVGRFSYQKGQDVLLAAFAQLHAKRPNTRLRIVGYGIEEGSLRAQIAHSGLQSVVSLEHHPDNPQSTLAGSDVYVSTSRWEGWSLAICEALRFGLPVISTDCDFGPSDILVDPRLGRLVAPDAEADLVAMMVYYHDNLAEEGTHAEYRRAFIGQYDVERVVDVHADALRRASGSTIGKVAVPAPV